MEQYKDFIKKANATLTIFDVDDTLFKTFSKIEVKKKNGHTVKELSSSEFNNHKLSDGEVYGFDQFRSADVFAATSIPIVPMVRKLRAIQRNVMRSPLSRSIIVTARADLDSKAKVVSFFNKHGIDVDNEVFIERSGNLNNPSTAAAKKIIFDRYLETGVYRRVRLYDDAMGNLTALLSLKPKYPEVKFEAWLVRHDGSIEKVNP
ncbi:MAG: hypothetical protein DDT26_01823 [Dehalococcoidia bacterium]|nr:hypothetical protein [Chloroflexota bacterium]